MAIQDLFNIDPSTGQTHVGLAQVDPVTGQQYTEADLPTAPAGQEWISRGRGYYSLVPSTDAAAIQAADAQNAALYGEGGYYDRYQREVASRQADMANYSIYDPRIEQQRQEAGAPTQYEYLRDWANRLSSTGRSILGGGTSEGDEIVPDAYYPDGRPMTNSDGSPVTKFQMISRWANYYAPNPVVGKSAGVAETVGYGGGYSAPSAGGQAAMQQAAANAQAQAGASAMGSAADAANPSNTGFGSQAYGVGEAARSAAREAAQATTPSYTMPNAQAEAATKASPAMQDMAGPLPDAPLTTPPKTLSESLSGLLKSLPVVGKAIDTATNVGTGIKNVASALGENLKQNATSPTSPTSTKTDSSAFGNPMSVPSSPVSTNPLTPAAHGRTPEKPLAPTPSVPKGPYKAKLAPALTAKLRNEGLERNIEYGYNKLATPISARSNYTKPNRGMAGY